MHNLPPGTYGLRDGFTNGLRPGVTLGADKGYDVKAFIEEPKQRGIAPHIDRNTNGRRNPIDRRSARGKGYT